MDSYGFLNLESYRGRTFRVLPVLKQAAWLAVEGLGGPYLRCQRTLRPVELAFALRHS
jgi:hypothetical protein